MNSWSLLRPFLLVLVLACPLMLMGCPEVAGDDDDDDDATGEPTTVEDICATVFDCFANAWGWTSEDECQDLWLTGCADSDGYLLCTADCVAADCAGFALEDGTGGCEPDCWSGYCM
jgi:hypothetical protein